jgi:hypothetical protein
MPNIEAAQSRIASLSNLEIQDNKSVLFEKGAYTENNKPYGSLRGLIVKLLYFYKFLKT